MGDLSLGVGMGAVLDPPVAETFAYCLMPKHFHFLIRTHTEDEQRAYCEKIGPFLENGPILIAGGVLTTASIPRFPVT
jgi:hypothetical protein